MTKKIATLCFVCKKNKILLGMKKRGFGKGRWNGFGGKVLKKENIEECARRELREEAGIEAKKIEKIGELEFFYKHKKEKFTVIIFACENFKGNARETEEMKPRWFDKKNLPFDQMWPDDKFWMPLLLKNKKFKGRFVFEGYDKIIWYELKEVGG